MTTQRQLIITGATGTLGKAFDRVADVRGLTHVTTRRSDLDIGDPASVERALAEMNPWAVVNTAGYVRVDQAESEPELCERENTTGPVHLGAACANLGIRLVTFSSDLVFDGKSQRPYVESDPVAPLNVYGRTKAESERLVLERCPQALVIRTSAFFGPWDAYNFATIVLAELSAGRSFTAASDVTISPTYVPALVESTLDLLIDGERGIWHLANKGAVTWEQFAREVASRAGLDTSAIAGQPNAELNLPAPRPAYTVLGSERGAIMPDLETSIGQFLEAVAQPVL